MKTKSQLILALIVVAMSLWYVCTSPWFDLTPDAPAATMEIVESDEPHYAPNYEQDTEKLFSNTPAFGEVKALDCFYDTTATYWQGDFSKLATVCALPDGYGIIYTDKGTVVSTDTVSVTTQAELDMFMQTLGYSR